MDTVLLPPMQPILKGLRRAKQVNIQVAYSEDGEKLVGKITYQNSSNGSFGQLPPAQTQRVLEFVDRNGLQKLIEKMPSVAVSY